MSTRRKTASVRYFRLPILPIPPLQQPSLRSGRRSKVDRAAKNVEQTTIDVHALLDATALVQILGVRALQVRDGMNAKPVQVLGNARPDAGNRAQLAQGGLVVSHDFS